MPTHDELERFLRDYDRLTEEQKIAFATAVARFVADLRKGHLRAGLRVRGVQGAQGIYEMTWAPDGRATFQYGEPVRDGEPRIIWRRIRAHDICREP